MSTEPTVEFRAIAEDGASIRVLVQSGAPDSLIDYLPARGLLESGIDTETEPEITLDLELVSDIGKAYLESSLGHFAASHLQDDVAIHSALIRAGDQLVMLPAPSLSGKTSLCVAARQAGHEVLGDEYVLVNPSTGFISTWSRDMRIRTQGAWRKEAIDRQSGPLHVTLVAVLRFVEPGAPDGDPLSFRQLSPGELAVELISNCVSVQYRPEDSLAAAMAIARNTPGILGERGEAGPALSALLNLRL
ncbi:MAG: hypothetical protein Q8M73_05460 [Actinomycetota bacterium]|nr:hypothetical protein [Actinomycetota bacterium]